MLDIRNLNVRLGTRQILDDVTTSIREGEFVVIVGPNGCGKTTLLRAVAGLVQFEGGIELESVTLAARKVAERTELISYLPQERIVHWPLTVEQVVGLGFWTRGNRIFSGADVAALVEGALSECGLTELRHRSMEELSGGEAARALLARALAMDARLLLADEPTASLDPAHRIEIMKLLNGYSRRGRTVLAATHDIDLAIKFADRMIILANGQVAADDEAAKLASGTILDEVFGVRFSRAQVDGETLIAALHT